MRKSLKKRFFEYVASNLHRKKLKRIIENISRFNNNVVFISMFISDVNKKQNSLNDFMSNIFFLFIKDLFIDINLLFKKEDLGLNINMKDDLSVNAYMNN